VSQYISNTDRTANHLKPRLLHLWIFLWWLPCIQQYILLQFFLSIILVS